MLWIILFLFALFFQVKLNDFRNSCVKNIETLCSSIKENTEEDVFSFLDSIDSEKLNKCVKSSNIHKDCNNCVTKCGKALVQGLSWQVLTCLLSHYPFISFQRQGRNFLFHNITFSADVSVWDFMIFFEKVDTRKSLLTRDILAVAPCCWWIWKSKHDETLMLNINLYTNGNTQKWNNSK